MRLTLDLLFFVGRFILQILKKRHVKKTPDVSSDRNLDPPLKSNETVSFIAARITPCNCWTRPQRPNIFSAVDLLYLRCGGSYWRCQSPKVSLRTLFMLRDICDHLLLSLGAFLTWPLIFFRNRPKFFANDRKKFVNSATMSQNVKQRVLIRRVFEVQWDEWPKCFSVHNDSAKKKQYLTVVETDLPHRALFVVEESFTFPVFSNGAVRAFYAFRDQQQKQRELQCVAGGPVARSRMSASSNSSGGHPQPKQVGARSEW